MYWGWKPYVPVASRRASADKLAKQHAKKLGRPLRPINLPGKKIATTFWGKGWCDHLEEHSDCDNRLPRGRTYVRNGSVLDLEIVAGKITALVSGSELYKVVIQIDKVKAALWKKISAECSRSIDSLLDLLQGKLSDGVMKRLTHPSEGLFPQSQEMHKACSCPDGAIMCKHVAAVLYGVGSRLDQEPHILFSLRGVNHLDLIATASASENLQQSLPGAECSTLSVDDLGAVFGIELEGEFAIKTTVTKKTPARIRQPAKSKPPALARRKAAKSAAKSAAKTSPQPVAREKKTLVANKLKVKRAKQNPAATKKVTLAQRQAALRQPKAATAKPRAK